MRIGRSLQTGRGQAALTMYGQNNIYRTKLPTVRSLATDQTPALKFANQCNYANPNYSYDGSPAPSFYGYSGMGYGGWSLGFQTVVNFQGTPRAIYVVDSTVPTQTVTFVNFSDPTTWTPQPPGAHHNLQDGFNAVPVPDVTKIPQGQIWPNGTDRQTTIWRPSTNEVWEMWRLYGSPGSYVFGNGGYTNTASGFNCIWPNNWGSSATGIAVAGGVLTVQDVVGALQGVPITHALKMDLEVIADALVPPAQRHDFHSSTPQFQADGTTPNPAFGFVDAVAEATWFAFPASFNPASAMPGAGPIALAIATAIRDYGIVTTDGAGNSSMQMEDSRNLGSPYSWAKVNPFAGSTGAAAGVFDAYINNFTPSTWTDSTLPKITEPLTGVGNVLSQIPWQQLQVLEPFSS